MSEIENMTAASTPQMTTKPAKRNNIMAVVSQYLTEKQYSLFIPMEIILLYWVISAIIMLLYGIKAGLPLPTQLQSEEADSNFYLMMSVPWFLVVGGSLCVNRQFNAALAFGSTRRDFWLGTILGFIVTSATSGIFALVALFLEKATNHWWVGIHAFDVAPLGSGNYAMLFWTMFTLCMLSLIIGATYGTVFRSFGAKTLTVSIIATLLVLIALLALFIWKSTPILDFLNGYGYWTIGTLFAIVGIIMAAAGYIINQHATM